jgi:surfeit locus 1 family protein
LFTFRLWPTLITLVMFAVLIGLGAWQMQRLHWKENLLATIKTRMAEAPVDVSSVDASGADYRPASASGVFKYDREIYLHAISLSGEGGWHVLTPLKLDNGKWLLVDRGFVPFEKAETKDFYRPDGHMIIKGIARVPTHHWPQPENDPAKNDWYWPDLAALAKAMDVPQFMPFVLDADVVPSPGGYPIGGQTRLDIPNNHFVYALTWFGLAAALLVIYGVSGFRKVT